MGKKIHFLANNPTRFEIIGGEIHLYHGEKLTKVTVKLDMIKEFISMPHFKEDRFPPKGNVDLDYIVYIPEQGDELMDIYTVGDFLDLCDGDWEKAEELFNRCEWQSPDTILEEDKIYADEDDEN